MFAPLAAEAEEVVIIKVMLNKVVPVAVQVLEIATPAGVAGKLQLNLHILVGLKEDSAVVILPMVIIVVAAAEALVETVQITKEATIPVQEDSVE
jgi:hypothetical protein